MVILIITGASRGFGRALATLAATSQWGNESSITTIMVRLLLVARSKEGLEETAAQIIRQLQQQNDGASQTVQISCHPMDLGDLSMLDNHLDTLLNEIDRESTTFSMQGGRRRRIILIQNAGTIGHLGPSRTSPSLKDMQANIDLNITSCLWTSARLTNYYYYYGRGATSTTTNEHDNNNNNTSLTIVNISSLVAIADFPTFGIYSAGKAARDKYHALIAKEENEERSPLPSREDTSNPTFARGRIRTLNYAPGPLETDMVTEIRDNIAHLDASLQDHYRKPQLDPMVSARKLLRLLQQGDDDAFESGAHIDYYDLPDE